ncbi:hypothetical protein ACFL54_00745 [Planctomycetota bacterium]
MNRPSQLPIITAIVLLALLLLIPTVATAGKNTEQYKKLAAKIKEDDAKGNFQLASWCQKNRLPVLARKHLKLTVKINPEHKQARKFLGYQKVDGKWYTPKDAKIAKARIKFATKKNKADASDSRAMLILADYARKNKLRAEAEECYQALLKLDGENKKAHAGLGHLFLDGVWKKREEWKQKYFDLKDNTARAEYFKILKKAGLKEPESGLQQILRWRDSPRGKHEGLKLKDTDLYPTGQYIIITPKEIDLKTKYPLLVCLHGGGKDVGKGSDIVGLYVERGKKDGYIMVFPDALAHNNAAEWSNSNADAYVVALIEEIRRDYPIDETRIFLAGVSMGGAGCWGIGTNHPELFAGIAPVCGGSYDAKFVNCRDMVVYFAHGDKDVNVPVENSRTAAKALENLGYDFTYRELAGCDHDVPLKDFTVLFDIFNDYHHPHPGSKK